MFKMWLILCGIFFLFICSLFDLRERQIPMIVIYVGIFASLGIRICEGIKGISLLDVIIALLPGICFWLLSFISHEKVGYGDGWLLIFVGVTTGFRGCLLILLVSMVLESVLVIFLLAIGRIQKDEEMAFAPFLLTGMVVVTCL